MTTENDGGSDFDQLVGGLDTQAEFTGQSTMPPPGYFCEKIEHLTDLVRVEGQNLDRQGSTQPSMSFYALQAALQANLAMAQMSIQFFSAFTTNAPCGCDTCDTEVGLPVDTLVLEAAPEE